MKHNSVKRLVFGVVLILSGCSIVDIETPTLSTVEVTNITEKTAVSGGIISTDNGSIITARGVCWSTSPNPTIADNKIESTVISTDTFTCNLTGLIPKTTYYVRAFATNAGGTAYGEQVSFVTMAFELTTLPPTSITATTAISGGMVSFDNDRPDALSRGVCWNELPNPTTSNNITLDGVGKGSFTSTMSGLKQNTTYYVRAYITNNEGTMYGDEHCFTTLAGIPMARFEYVDMGWFKVTFTNNSDYPTSCFWDFGDGTTSTETSPTHVYNSIGLYHVTLTVSNNGLSNSITKSIDVTDIVPIDNLPLGWWNGLIGRYIDVDGDGYNDFFTYGYSHTGPSQSYSYTGIMTFNNYELVYDSLCHIDPTKSSNKGIVPKIFVVGNSISISDKTTTTAITNLYFTYSYFSWNSGSYSYDILGNDGIKYVGFIKRAGDNSKIGWIKFKDVSTLYSFKIPSKCTSLLIDK